MTTTRKVIAVFETTKATALMKQKTSLAPGAASNAASQASDTEEERDEVFGGCEGPVHEDIPATDEPPEPCEGMDRSPSKMDANINDDDIAYASAFTAIEENPFVDALGSAAEDPVDFGDEERGDNTDGDVDLLETSLVESLVKRNGLSTDQLMVEEALDDCDSDFREILEARQRMEADELNRLQTRQELESYVTSLAGKTDESGQQLVQFPKNFQRIVALMTAADLREEGERSKTPGPVQKSWSEVLIQTSLLKQQAYGSLDEDTDGKTDEQNELESKIAMKIARIRQLDAVLEQKLGKSLYSTIGAVKKKLPATAQSAKPTGLTGRTFVTQPPPSASKQSVTNDTTGPRMFESSAEPQDEEAGDEPRRNAGKRKNFIERNMKIIESSGKSKWTLDEELRLGRLLDQTTETIGEAAAAPSTDTNAFALQDADRFAIDNLIASNQGKYEPIVAFLDKQAANDETRDLVADRNLAPDVRHAGARKPNVIQASKTDRLVAQRLHRIDEELRFLREHENLDIVADDEAAAMDQDDCVSVSSFASRSSISSAASTRSCISRSEFQNFMRSQVQQQGGDPSAKTASPEEIRRLLLSLNRGHSAAPSTVRTVTSS
ncbi:TPA: LOW QUALITY PROTEIN: hypothetical protein N0F65_011159 [Lagenidium giganteum]|uniref:Fibrous sheath-interacting protein 1 n=1 Tax=Lagenidium giganteum TaxID=4803 RepID=A0AAV2Z5Y6_9STRA|nr:TPA: LOW QUALITY PROTEIN: hypothetical protein N0F65_011159 [Lagenidium giganteum]